MGKIKSSKEEDIALFNQILKDNIAMLIGKSDKFAIDLFASKILDGIGEVRIYDWNEFDEIINERVYGYVDYISENTQAMVYGTTGYTGDIEFIEKLFSDVIWHILMVYFCKSYGSHFKRKLFLKQGTVEVSNYAGFLKSEIEQGIATSGSMMIDNLTRLLALAVIKKRNDSNFIIDDVFKKGVGDKQKTSPFDNLLTFHQMFVAAFSLANNNWLEENYNAGKGILDSTLISDGGKCSKNNIFVTESIRNPIAVMDEYDKYNWSGAYIALQIRIDELCKTYIDDGVINTKGFAKVAKELQDFTFKRIYDYCEKGVITSATFVDLYNDFMKLYEIFLEDLRLHKIKKTKQKFKKAVNRLLNLK